VRVYAEVIIGCECEAAGIADSYWRDARLLLGGTVWSASVCREDVGGECEAAGIADL
jgi:hypothetical protein